MSCQKRGRINNPKNKQEPSLQTTTIWTYEPCQLTDKDRHYFNYHLRKNSQFDIFSKRNIFYQFCTFFKTTDNAHNFKWNIDNKRHIQKIKIRLIEE